MRLAAFTASLALAISALAMPPVPRKSPEFTIVEPSGKQTLLSSLKGKVVVIEFLSTTCPHCQQASMMFSRLYKELGPRGFQPLGVAFNTGVTPAMVTGFVQQFGATYPVGYSSAETVYSYLGFSVMDRVMVPQIVVIDRKGMIRAQSPVAGDPNLQNEAYIRNLIEGLLKENHK